MGKSMGEKTKIEWAHHTFNPWYGCQKVGPGCDHCYAEGWAKRSGLVQWGPGTERRRSSSANWKKPLAWNAEAERLGIRYRVFCASLADVFDNAVPDEWRLDLFSLIAKTPHLDWLLVTKRIGNVMSMCSGDGLMFDMICDRVWLGITVCNQEEADRDIPKLLSVPARVRFLSMEPLLGPVDLRKFLSCRWGHKPNDRARYGCNDMLDWVVCGGESGSNARPMHPDWVRGLRDQCAAVDVPFLFKQWGEWAPREPYASEWMESDELCGKWDGISYRYGKQAAGRRLDGVQHDQYPAI